MLVYFVHLSGIFVAICGLESLHFYVSPTGSDNNDGKTVLRPFKTIEKAVSKLSGTDVTGKHVYIELMAGYHDIKNTITLTRKYGTGVTFRAYDKKQVHITGGKVLQTRLFHPVTDPKVLQKLPNVAHHKVRQLKFSDAGITIQQLGHLERFGFASKRTAPLEVFYNSKPLRLARWPNDGSYVNVLSTPDGRNGHRFTYDSSRMGSKAEKWKEEKDLWVYGFWYWGWADDSAHVAKLDPSSHMITLDTGLHSGMRPGRIDLGAKAGFTTQGGYFNVFNALSELDEEGEYYVDKSNGILYLWPPEHAGTIASHDKIYASMINNLFELSDLASVTFQDLVLEYCRHMAVTCDNVTNTSFEKLEIRNTGSYAISISSSTKVTVRQCEIHDTDGGIIINGGDRAKLIPSGNVVENNHIWHFSRAAAVGQHGVDIGGVGGRVEYNEIDNARYTGIWWLGNDNIIRKNHIHHLCTGASDCGGIHTGRDWTCRGNVIQENHIHHVLRFYPGAGVRGIMLDDQYSSVTIQRNVFHDNELHMNIGGGRDNIVRYNVFYNATTTGIGLDGRGLGHSTNEVTLNQRLESVPYTSDLWSHRYPNLSRIDSENPQSPRGNQIYKNVFYPGSTHSTIHYSGQSLERSDYFDVHDNLAYARPAQFNNKKSGDYRVVCTDWTTQQNYPQPPTLAEVGPHLALGPSFKHGKLSIKRNGPLKSDCTLSTVAPSTQVPRSPFVNDGSQPNTLTDSDGCWLIVTDCPNQPGAHGTHRDTNSGAHTDEASCLARAGVQWKACGSPQKSTVKAVYGPTGSWTIAGAGCFMASYGCPAHGSWNNGVLSHDHYAEDHGGATNEQLCLNRAALQWVYCGSSPDDPIVSIYGPTGARRIAGYGCWIQVPKCPKDKTVSHMFFDAWGDTNLNTGADVDSCFYRAQNYWEHCGSNKSFPVTAHFRPKAKSKTYPA